MKPQEVNVFKLTGQMPVPESIDEYDKLGKAVGTALKNAIRYTAYHVTYGDIRDAFIYGIDEEKEGDVVKVPKFTGIIEGLGIPMKMKKVKDDDGKEIEMADEKDEQYVNRVRAVLVSTKKATDEAGANAILQPYLDGAIKACPFDPSVSERKAGPKKLAQTWIDSALNFLLGKKNAAGKTYNLDKAVAAVKKELGKEFKKTGNEAEDSKTLGWLLKDLDAAIAAKARAAREDALAG